MKYPTLLFILCVISCNSHDQNESLYIYNLHNDQSIAEFNLLELDTQYKNLLDPRGTATELQVEVINSWSTFHNEVGIQLKERGFSWGSERESIKLLNKIYFDANSDINYYAFRILDEVPDSKIKEFQQQMEAILPNIKIQLKRDAQFAQCGKVEYQNF